MNAPETEQSAAALLDRLLMPEETAQSSRGDAARAGYIDVWHLQASRFGLAYGAIIWVEYVPSGALTLRFSSHTVRVQGRNLDQLYEQILRHEVSTLRGISERNDTGGEGDLVIHRVVVTPEKKAAPGPLEGLVPDFETPPNEPES